MNGANKQDYFQVLDGVEIRVDERECLVIQASHLGDQQIVTNDLVEPIGTKCFRWLGRWDNVINSGGVKISPEEIETIVEMIFDSMKLKNRFFVAGWPDEELGEKVLLIVEGDSFAEELCTLLRSSLNQKLHAYRQPKDIIFIEYFIVSETEKVLRRDTLASILKKPLV